MRRARLPEVVTASLALALAAFAAHEPVAEACGGCFSPPRQTERTVVTDHRMAFSVSPKQTVLWDQIRYAGDPKEFAWVLPVHPGAKVELSHDEWFAALDASTQPVVIEPANVYGGGGCALAGCSSSNSSFGADAPGKGQVQIVSQSVIGPYETVTLRATDAQALTTWLNSHAYEIPAAIQPTIDAYTSEGFDFIALRLRPACNERSMKPVRIVTPGADASLPLRMIAAGVGARVGITLYVITEGRYHPQNFPDAVIDYAKLTWDRTQNRSNYEELSLAAMNENKGRSWLTEYANQPQLIASGYSSGGSYYGSPSSSFGGNPGLADAYLASCRTPSYGSPNPSSTGSGGSVPPVPCDRGMEKFDAGTADADVPVDAAAPPDGGADGGDASVPGDAGDAATDAAPPRRDSGVPTPTPSGTGTSEPPPDYAACPGFDDLDVAMKGLHRNDVWVTRLRAVLPVDALSIGDLRLEPTRNPHAAVTNVHNAVRYSDQPEGTPPTSTGPRRGCGSAPREHEAFGSVVLAGATVLGLFAAMKRRSKKTAPKK